MLLVVVYLEFPAGLVRRLLLERVGIKLKKDSLLRKLDQPCILVVRIFHHIQITDFLYKMNPTYKRLSIDEYCEYRKKYF